MVKRAEKLGNLKIKRNTYTFSQRRRYSPVSNYSIRKKADTPLKEFVEKIFGSKKFGEPKKTPQTKDEAKKSATSMFSTIIKAAGVAIILILVAVAWFVLMLSGAGGGSAQPAQPTSFSGIFDLQIFSLGTLTHGAQEEGMLHQGYLMLDYVQKNVSSLSINAKLYSTSPSRQVFVLQYPRDGADTYSEFRRVLEINLAKKGGLQTMQSLRICAICPAEAQ